MDGGAAPPQPSGSDAIGEMTSRILALFREQSVLLSDNGQTIELRHLQQVLQVANPTVFTADEVRLLCANMQADGGLPAGVPLEPSSPVPVEAFVRFVLLGDSQRKGGDAARAGGGASPAGADDDHASALKAAALSVVAEDPPAIRVRKLNGALVLTIGSLRVQGMDVGTLQSEVVTAISGESSTLDVQLLVGVERLQDPTAPLTPMIPEDGVLEVTICMQDLPRLDANKAHLEQLDVLVKMLECQVLEKQREGLVCFRKLLSIEQRPPVQEVIDAGVLPKFIDFAQDKSGDSQLTYEALWALTNIASGTTEQTLQMLDLGAAAVFIETLKNPEGTMQNKDQSLWALGNIAGDSAALRDRVLNEGAVEPVVALLETIDQVSDKRNLAWMVSNLVRGKPKPDFDVVAPLVPHIARLAIRDEQEAVLVDACWSLSYLSDGPDEWLERVAAQPGIVDRLIFLLVQENKQYQTPALRTLGNLCTGPDDVTQAVLDAGFLPAVSSLLCHVEKTIRKESLWALSNIAAGTSTQIQAMIEAGHIPVVAKLAKEDEFEVKKEALWVIDNISSGGTAEQVDTLMNQGGLEPLMKAMGIGIEGNAAWQLQERGLNSVMEILKKGQNLARETGGENPFANEIVNAYGLEWLDEFRCENINGQVQLDEIRGLLGNSAQ